MNTSDAQKPIGLIVLIIAYAFFSITNVFQILRLGMEFEPSFQVLGSVVVRIFWLVGFWSLVYLLGKKKKNAYRTVFALEITRSIYSIVIFMGSFQSLSLLPEIARHIFEFKIIIQAIILPSALILLAHRSKKYLVN